MLYFNAGSSVAAFIEAPDRRVLYLRRARDPAKGKLGMPGGFTDLGETAETALVRETREEVGLELTGLEYLTSFPNGYDFGGVRYITLDLFFVAWARDWLAARPLDGVESLEWVDPAHVDPSEIAFESMRKALGVYLGYRERS